MSDEAERDGLRRVDLQTDAELRLRSVGIRVDSTAYATLEATVDTTKTETGTYLYVIRLVLVQPARLLANPDLAPVSVTTWSAGGSGTKDASRLSEVRDRVRKYIDQFANAYLSVNPK